MPIIITGKAGDAGWGKFMDGFMGGQEMASRRREEKRQEEHYQDELKMASEKASQQQMLQLKRMAMEQQRLQLAQDRGARDQELFDQGQGERSAAQEYGVYDRAAGQAGVTTGQLEQGTRQALEAFGELATKAGMLPADMMQTIEGMVPDSRAAFNEMSEDMRAFHLKREDQQQKQMMLQQQLQEAGHDLTTTRALEVSGRVPEGTADLLEQQLQAGELDPLELREATLKSEQEAALYHGSIAESERMVKQWRDEQKMRSASDYPLPLEARHIMAELESAVRLRAGHPGMKPIDFESYAEKFRRASVPEELQRKFYDEGAADAMAQIQSQAEFTSQFPNGVLGGSDEHRMVPGDRTATRERAAALKAGDTQTVREGIAGDRERMAADEAQEAPQARGGKPEKPVKLTKLKSDDPARLQEIMSALHQAFATESPRGDDSTPKDVKVWAVRKAAELGLVATWAEIEKHLNFEAPFKQDEDAPPLRSAYDAYREKRKKSGKGGTGGSGDQEGT